MCCRGVVVRVGRFIKRVVVRVRRVFMWCFWCVGVGLGLV